MLHDLRYAIRAMRANPLFTAMAMLSLALGIGANTAIYSFMDAILMRSLPVQNPQSLVVLHLQGKAFPKVAHGYTGTSYGDPKSGFTGLNFPYPAFELLSANSPVFSSLFGYSNPGQLNLLIQGQADLARGQYVTGGFFSGLGVPPAAGRLIDGADDCEGAAPVIVASYRYAQRRVGEAANAIGQSVRINDMPFTIAGVTPPAFLGINPGGPTDVYLPQHTSLLLDTLYPGDPHAKYADLNRYWLEMMGRLRPGVTMAQAQAMIGPQFHNFVAATASKDEERADLPAVVLQEGAGGLDGLRRQYSKPLYVLMTMVGLILMIACANIANLLLARSTARRREMAIRLALGAGRARVVRQLLTESVLLASFGGLLGLGFAKWGIAALTWLIANGREHFTVQADLNWHVLALALGLALVTGTLFGLAPALQSTRVDLTNALKQTRAGEQRFRVHSWVRVSLSQALVVSQIAISVLLLIAAGLFVRTLTNLNSIELGFQRENILLFNVNARQAGYRDGALVRFYDNLQTRLSGVPGVRSASASNYALVSNSMSTTRLTVPGFTGENRGVSVLDVAPNFFSTMQIPILLGREIDRRDIAGTGLIAVVNEVFVKKYLGGQNPIGRHFSLGVVSPRDFEIVGVSRNALYSSLKEEIPALIYIPYNNNPKQLGSLNFELRAAGDPLILTNAAREIVRQADARIPLSNVTTQAAQIDQTIGQERTFAMLCVCFAVLAVAIACVGLYGTMAYSVARRTNELGLRMALGAERRRLIWMVMREVLGMAAAGLAIGLPIAFVASRFVKAFLFGMKPNDPWAISGAAVILLAAALAAGYGPAWRASRIDPWTALRHE